MTKYRNTQLTIFTVLGFISLFISIKFYHIFKELLNIEIEFVTQSQMLLLIGICLPIMIILIFLSFIFSNLIIIKKMINDKKTQEEITDLLTEEYLPFITPVTKNIINQQFKKRDNA